MCDHVGRVIAGRGSDVHLNGEGRAQAEQLAELLDAVPLDAVVSSPLPRAVETATPLAHRRQLPVQVLESLSEVDFGEWTGRAIDNLEGETGWRRFNELRSVACIPGGESMLEVQSRTVATLERLRARYPHGRCAVVSHGDVIRSFIAHSAGVPLDLFQRLEITPASVSVVVVDESWIGVKCTNLTAESWRGAGW